MSSATLPRSNRLSRRKPPHRVIIARGSDVRTFTIRPWTTGIAATVVAALGVLYLAATGYLAFRDDLLAASIARQTRMQHTYEDRIAALRANIDRLTSRQLLNQQQVEADMDRLVDRQAALDARQDVIAGLSQAARRVGIAPAPSATNAAAPEAVPPKDKSASAAPAAGSRGILAGKRHDPRQRLARRRCDRPDGPDRRGGEVA